MAHQSLYRRYRPRRFADLRGQDHVVRALRNAVSQGSEGHAYLFSGPRGTGKTSTARILAKALNCEHLVDGEPCAECESCLSIEHGSSYDLFELDAASNNGVEAMRDLVSRTVVGSPGRTKVYILDEVHMLSTGASNALLKTLEEPPEHVCFVLATTDPQKVLPTIRSRTQHFEFSLLSAGELEEYVRWISADADLGVSDESIEYVVRQGRGSARDTLSALDMVVAAGGVLDRSESVDEILAAVAERDLARAMVAVSEAVGSGREPRVLAERLIASLRDAFLSSVRADLAHLSDTDQTRMGELAGKLGLATITRALELLGSASVDMRQAADPRVPLEVALIKLCAASADGSVDALVERIETLERQMASGSRPQAQLPSAPAAAPPAGPAAVRAPIARNRGTQPAPAPVAPAPVAPAPTGDFPSKAELADALSDTILGQLRGMSKALYSGGRFIDVVDGHGVFAFGNAPTRERAERVRPEVEAALAGHFGRPIPLRLVDDESGPSQPKVDPVVVAPEEHEPEESIDLAELSDADDVATTGVDKLVQAFPGAVVIDEEDK